ncbi:hypothetical protein CJ030_MR6G023560 [Morella rubra]|uniref:RNase H type-1 domain-containing protein n=1 Tax=Morella rubra TaxID=262757 RepID=A0A6A1VBF2_9ROSI|nr:hypothetical protein CJ030_MR6G023560 [Morella rubra]
MPPNPGWMKIIFDVVVHHNGSYITISCRDSSSSLCTAYMERIMVMDPLMGESWVAARVVELACQHGWGKVIFETNS